MQAIVDDAVAKCKRDGHSVQHVCVWHNTAAGPADQVPFEQGRDVWWHDTVEKQSTSCDIIWLDAEARLFKVSYKPLFTPLVHALHCISVIAS